MKNYLPNDEESKHCATLLQWDNIYYQPPTDSFVDKKTTVRVGLVQWQMRSYHDAGWCVWAGRVFYRCRIGLQEWFRAVPWYFNAPLMAKFNHMGEAQSIRALAQYTEEIRDRFINLAIKHNINIITGSMPYVKEDGGLYKCRFPLPSWRNIRDVRKDSMSLPIEVKSWGLSGGKRVQTFETDCAKIGVLICYDVEFPELSRLMADQGMQICLFRSWPIRRTDIHVYVYVRRHVPSKTNVLWLLPEV